jgi:hypothetical protein
MKIVATATVVQRANHDGCFTKPIVKFITHDPRDLRQNYIRPARSLSDPLPDILAIVHRFGFQESPSAVYKRVINAAIVDNVARELLDRGVGHHRRGFRRSFLRANNPSGRLDRNDER